MVVVDSAGSSPLAVCRKFGTAFAPNAADGVTCPLGSDAAADGRGVIGDAIAIQKCNIKKLTYCKRWASLAQLHGLSAAISSAGSHLFLS